MSKDETEGRRLGKVVESLRQMKERRLVRRASTGFGFAFADRIDYLDPARWDGVVGNGSVLMSRPLLRVFERHGPANVTQRYGLVFRGDKPVAALAAQVVTVDAERLQHEKEVSTVKPGLLRRVLASTKKSPSLKFRERVIVAGNLMSWGAHGIAFAEGEDPKELWPAIAEGLYRIRRAEKLNGQPDFMMVKDLAGADGAVEALRNFSYRPLETEPNMVLTLDPGWGSYDDYLAALDAKYRRNAKDQMKKLLAAGCSIEQVQDLTPHASRLHELYLGVHRNARVRLVTLPDSFLPALAQAGGENFRCTLIRQGEEIVGFVTSLKNGDEAIGYYIGFDRERAATGLPIYLRLLHATIGDAIAWKCKTLSLGRTALEPKAALGAKPQPLNVWLRHRVPALNWVIRGLLDAVPHAEAPERSPFKGGSGMKGAN